MKWKGSLTPLSKGKERPVPPFGTCDIESRNWIEFLVIGIYESNRFRSFKSMEGFFKSVFESDVEIFFAHFGGIFDFMFLIKAALESDDYEVENIIPRGSSLLCFDLVWKKKKMTKKEYIEQINLSANDRDPSKIKVVSFRDSSALLPFGLARITKSFGVEHKKMDYDVSNLQKVTFELLEYLKYDNIGLYESLCKFFEWRLIKISGPAFTMASQSMKVFRLFLKEPVFSLSKREDDFIRRGYFGGRTEIFKPEFKAKNKKEKLYAYDVNSLYPYIMRNFEMPIKVDNYTYDYDPNKIGFYEAEAIVPEDILIPVLPALIDTKWSKRTGNPKAKKLIFPTGKFKGVWSTAEIERAREIGCEVRTGLGLTFKSGGKIFEEFVDVLYDMRRKAIEKDDGVGNIVCKLLMNANYGRWGLRREREQVVFDDGSPELRLLSPGDGDAEIEANGSIYRLMKKEIYLNNAFSFVAVSSWITSLARIHLHKIIWPIRKDVYYTDTDSIFTTRKLETGNALGELKLEMSATKAIFLLPKTYVTENEEGLSKIAMKGFDKRKIQHFRYDDFFMALEGDLRLLKVTHDAKFATFKTAARKGNLLTLSPESAKAIKSLYDKRQVYKNKDEFLTRPIHIN